MKLAVTTYDVVKWYSDVCMLKKADEFDLINNEPYGSNQL